jgi:hypothetical protein
MKSNSINVISFGNHFNVQVLRVNYATQTINVESGKQLYQMSAICILVDFQQTIPFKQKCYRPGI